MNEDELLALERDIAQGKERTGRSCGRCSLCCLLLNIDEIHKPGGTWCQHARPGKGGCAIYERRPVSCRAFTCMWLINSSIPDYWSPLRSKMVLNQKLYPVSGKWVMIVHVHPDYPNRWREQPYYADIKRLAYKGLIGVPQVYSVIISIGSTPTHLVLPNKEVPYPADGGCASVVRIGENEWDCTFT